MREFCRRPWMSNLICLLTGSAFRDFDFFGIDDMTPIRRYRARGRFPGRETMHIVRILASSALLSKKGMRSLLLLLLVWHALCSWKTPTDIANELCENEPLLGYETGDKSHRSVLARNLKDEW